MPTAFVQQATGSKTSGTTVNITLGANPVQGNTLILTQTGNIAPLTYPSGVKEVSGGGVSRWMRADSGAFSNWDTDIWYGIVDGTPSTSIVVTAGGTGNMGVNVAEWLGPLVHCAPHRTAAAGTSTTPSAGTVNPPAAPALIYAVLGRNNNDNLSSGPTGGFTGLTQVSAGPIRNNSAYLLSPLRIPGSTTWTVASQTWDTLMVTFLSAPGPRSVYDNMILTEMPWSRHLTAYWPDWSVSPVPDESGNRRDITLVNTPTLGVASGIFGEGNIAASFAKASSEYGWHPAGPTTWFEGSEGTLECWCIIDGADTDTGPLSSAGAINRGFNLYVPGTNQIQCDNGITNSQAYSIPGGPGSTWHHWVGTHDGDSLKCYWDGVLVTQRTASARGRIPPGGEMVMGNYGDVPGLNGAYEDFTICKAGTYKIALSPAAIAKHYLVGTTGKGYS